MPVIKQTNLSGGVLRPELWGRTDIPKYGSYMARLENVYPTPTGQLVNRPGFRYVGTTKNNVQARLVPMTFSAAQSYIVEFTPLAIRVIRNGAYINITTGPSDTIVSTYTAQDIADMKCCQTGDELWIVCPNVKPRGLVRTSENSWALLDISFNRNVLAPTGLGYDTGFVPVTTSDTVGHIAKKWEWVVTAWSADKTDESPPSSVFSVAAICVYDDMPVRLKWNAVSGASQYSVYRGRNGQFGFVGTSTTTVFNDDGQVPLLSDDPPIDRNPFKSVATGGHGNPRVLTFHQGRSVFANPEDMPEGIFLSQSGIFTNFDYALVPRDTDAIDIELATPRYSEIRNMSSFKDSLLLFTATNETVIQGLNGDPLDATSIPSQRTQSYWGSSQLEPIIIGNSVLWQLDGGFPFRDFFYDAQKEMWVGRDLSVSSGVAKDVPITSWALQRSPSRVIWACSESDGLLYSLTYDSEMEVVAWARHAVDGGEGGGRVLSLASIPEMVDGAPIDAVYAVIAYDNPDATDGVTYTVQRMLPRQDYNPLYEDHVYLDCATTFSGVAQNGGAKLTLARVTGTGDYNIGQTFTVTADVSVFVSGDVGDWIVLYPGNFKNRIKLRIDSRTSGNVVTCTLVGGNLGATDDTQDGIYRFLGTTAWADQYDWGFARWSFDTTLYATIFENQTDVPLMVRFDDKWQWMSTPTHTINTGESGVTVPGADTTGEPAVFAVFGVAYRQLIETLDLQFTSGAGSQDMTLNVKQVKKAGLEMAKSWPSFLLGESEDDRRLVRWMPEPDRTTAEYGPESEDLTFSGLAFYSIQSGWNRTGRVVLVNDEPFPIGVSAIIREVEYGGT